MCVGGGGVGGADLVASRAGGGGWGRSGRLSSGGWGGGGRAGVPCDRVAWGARVLHVFNPSSMLLALNFSSVA